MDKETGQSLGILRPGGRIHDGIDNAYVVTNGRFRALRDTKDIASEVDCGPPPNAEYPIVVDAGNMQSRLALYREFGIIVGDIPGVRNAHHCGEDLSIYEMKFSDAAYTSYKSRGFDIRRLCAVMNSDMILFNPQSGERIPTYVYSETWTKRDGSKATVIRPGQIPFFAPSCFARGGEVTKWGVVGVTMTSLGCTVRYHPWSGRKLDDDEIPLFTRELQLHYSVARGGSTTDGDDLAGDATRRLSSARIEAIKKAASKEK